MDCIKISIFAHKGLWISTQVSLSCYTVSFVGPLPWRKSTHWDIRRRILVPTSLYCSCVWNLNESPWAGLPPTQILWVTMCAVGGKLICFQFSCFLAIVITLRLSYIGAWALKPSPAWRNTKKWFHKFLFFSLFLNSCFFLFSEASYINNCSSAWSIT